MPLFNDGEWFRGAPAVGVHARREIPRQDHVAVRRYRHGEDNHREGTLHQAAALAFASPSYEYQHIGPVANAQPEPVVAPPPPPPPPADPTTIDEWLDGGQWPMGASSVQLGGRHGGRCCGIRHIYRFWTGDYGENENSAPTVSNARIVRDYIRNTQQDSDNDAGGPGIIEACLTETQLEQRTFGWNWKDVLEHLGFIERYSFLNPNTDGRRVHVFHYCTDYDS